MSGAVRSIKRVTGALFGALLSPLQAAPMLPAPQQQPASIVPPDLTETAKRADASRRRRLTQTNSTLGTNSKNTLLG